MAGVPHHSVTPYIRTLVRKGYKVAVCDQVEDPKQAKGLVKREVTRIITPGTILDDDLLTEKANNFIVAVSLGKGTSPVEEFIPVEPVAGGRAGIAAADLSTGEFYTTGFLIAIGYIDQQRHHMIVQRAIDRAHLLAFDQKRPLEVVLQIFQSRQPITIFHFGQSMFVHLAAVSGDRAYGNSMAFQSDARHP